jgi:hypothetical protein
MTSKWPTRPETLVARFERAVIGKAERGSMPTDYWPTLDRDYERARRELLERVSPVTDYQRQQMRLAYERQQARRG